MKRFNLISTAVLLLSILGAAWVTAQTNFAVGSIIKGFEMPQRDKEGNLQTKIFGREATVMSQNRIRVRALTIDIYSGGNVSTKLTSDESDYWRAEGRLTTSSGVKVVQPSFVLTAKNMDWDLQNSNGSFKDQVKLVITQKNEVLPK